MGGRYWITGVQLGLLSTLQDVDVRNELIEKIIDKQFIGNYDELPEDIEGAIKKESRQKELKNIIRFMHSQFPKFNEKMFLEDYERFL